MFFATLWFWSPFLVLGYQINEYSADTLMDSVFTSYDRRIRPYADKNVPVRINMTIVLGILIEVRENEQVAAYVISHTQRWHDPKLRWRPHEHNDTRELIVPHSMIWLPKMFIYNSMDTKEMLTEEKYDVRIQFDGNVKINIPQYVSCICRLYIEQFPFDTQYCAVALASPLLTTEEMDVVTTQPPDGSYFVGNAEWLLVNVTARHMKFMEEGEYRSEVHYIFQLRRRPIFYITVIVVPIFLISALSMLGIFTPSSDSGPRNEKVSLGLGSLLSMTVILGIIASSMPKSNSVPLLGYYILTVIVLCALAVGISMAFLTMSRRLVEKGRVPSPAFYRLVFLKPKLFVGSRKSRTPRHSSIFRPSLTTTLLNGLSRKTDSPRGREDPMIVENGFQFDDLAKIHRIVRYLADEQRNWKKKADRDQTKRLMEKEWSRVFSRLDYVLLTIFETLNTSTLLFFLQFAWADPTPMREPLI